MLILPSKRGYSIKENDSGSPFIQVGVGLGTNSNVAKLDKFICKMAFVLFSTNKCLSNPCYHITIVIAGTDKKENTLNNNISICRKNSM
jgi:hypothetical protein